MSETLNPVYIEETCCSRYDLVTWTTLEEITKELQTGWMVFWQHHQVVCGKIVNGVPEWWSEEPPSLDQEHFVRFRAFNEEMEYHFWTSNGQIKGRKRVDGSEGTNCSVVDTSMVLRGVIADPLKTNEPDEFGDKTPTLALMTRNYIGYGDSEVAPAGYVDSRFVKYTILSA